MRYYVTLDGQTFEIDLTGELPRVDGAEVDAEVHRLPGTPTRLLLVDGRSHTLVARRDGADGWAVYLDGERFEADVVDERARAIREMTGQAAADPGPRPIRAPMPGLVVRVAVEAGDRVEAGQSVAIVEAMKMENDLKAESDGVVAKVLVEVGEPVEKGAVLVELEAHEESDE
ncbi:MAG: biotin/lipoyl-containing protein [Longimicrobiales bacterium]|nr:biotin/lipoyl-containing protein [Longimicrobiales bacterium]